MLELLHIENIAIIEHADIAFGSGFNALTGETGAGKSIVIDALGAVLGQRLSARVRRRPSSARPSAAYRRSCRGLKRTALRRRRTERSFCSASSTATEKTSAA